MVLFYVIFGLLGFGGYTYFLYYRGWKRGINCAEKVARKELARRLDKSKEAIELAQDKIEKVTIEIEKLQQTATQISDIKNKSKRKKAEDEYQARLQALSGIGHLGAQQGLAEAMRNQQANLGMYSNSFSRDIWGALGLSYPPWPFNL